jgi:hypothetical protein
MFVLLSSLLSIAVLGSLFYLSQKRENRYMQKYQILSTLREVVHLTRQHRSAAHLSLLYKQPHSSEIKHIQEEVLLRCQMLIDLTVIENKPLYRILLNQYTFLFNNWQENSVAKSQFHHGKLIRHTLYLIDEVTVSWLAESERDELSDEYHGHWQIVIESLEALTQLRISIQDIQDEQGLTRFRHNAERMVRRLNQLALISPLSIASPAGMEITRALEAYAESAESRPIKSELYELTSQISAAIFTSYDAMLDEIIESVYLPLPRLSLA